MVTLDDVGFGDVTDPVVRKALEDALAAASDVKGAGRKRRGGGPKEEAAARAAAAAAAERRSRASGEGSPAPAPAPAAAAPTAAAAQVSGDAVKNPSRLKQAVDFALTRIVPSTIAAGAGGAIVINRPDVVANLAEIVAVTLSEVTDMAITGTWGDWGQAVLGIGRAIGVISATGALQTFRGPAVPFAIATAIMTWRAQGAGKSLFQQIKDDASGAATGLSTGARTMAAKAMAALPGRPNPVQDMVELAQRARDSVVRGEGGIRLKDYVQSEIKGTPAVEGGPAGTAAVRGFRAPEPSSALERLARIPVGVDPGARSRRASQVIAAEARRAVMDVDGAAAPAREAEPLPAPRPGQKRGREGDEGESAPKRARSLGGRRKTRKARKAMKRRMTQRITFAY